MPQNCKEKVIMAILDVISKDGKFLGQFDDSFQPGYWRWTGKTNAGGYRQYRYKVFYELTREEREALARMGIVLQYGELRKIA